MTPIQKYIHTQAKLFRVNAQTIKRQYDIKKRDDMSYSERKVLIDKIIQKKVSVSTSRNRPAYLNRMLSRYENRRSTDHLDRFIQ